MYRTPFRWIVIVGIAFGTVVFSTTNSRAFQQDKPMSGMSEMQGMQGTSKSSSGEPCDDLSSMGGMSVMGESMAAMSNHMCITPMRPKQPDDEERAKALIAEVKSSIERYKNYKKALADGYVIANPKVDQPQAHFTNDANVRLADTQFDPTKPSSLLYRRTPTQRYKLEGVMFTDRLSATEDELNKRVPLSIARWHEHTNFCGAPADKIKEYQGEHPKFGMFGSIHTEAACKAEGGIFYPVIFSWMIHVFPYEENIKDVFSMDDDKAHVQ